MDRLIRYIDCYIPTETCNFKCHYCYIARQNKFGKKLVKLERDVKYIRKALSVERLGGKCLLNLCAGGETLLSHDVLDLMKELLEEGHYLTVVTNGSVTRHFQEISTWNETLRKHIMFKFSFHYLELIRLGMLERFFENIRMMRDCGASFTLEITPNDELIPYIEEIKRICINEVGALSHITIARDDLSPEIRHLSKLSFEDFVDTWSTFDSELLRFKQTIFYKKRVEFCYAGLWNLYLNISTGDLQQCIYGNYLGNIYDDINKRIEYCPVGNKCKYPHCYNGHAYLSLGAIPELQSPTYLAVRDRVDINGNHWISDEFASFMKQKFIDNHEELREEQKKMANRRNIKIKLNTICHKILKKVKI